MVPKALHVQNVRSITKEMVRNVNHAVTQNIKIKKVVLIVIIFAP